LPEIISIGYDLEEVRRFTKYLADLNSWNGLLKDVFSEEECARNNKHQFPASCYTLCFCYKEAMFKALGQSWMNAEVSWKDIELLFETSSGFDRFVPRLTAGALHLFNEKNAHGIECRIDCDQTIASCEVILSA
jgi:phosphopantetheine--protein transferase-like protein